MVALYKSYSTQLPPCSVVVIYSWCIYGFSVHIVCNCLTTTPPFSTTAMPGLPMTRQLWMETCGEWPSVVFNFPLWTQTQSTVEINLTESVLMFCPPQSVRHGWKVLLLLLRHHLLLPSQRQVHSRPEGHLWGRPQILPNWCGCHQTRLSSFSQFNYRVHFIDQQEVKWQKVLTI